MQKIIVIDETGSGGGTGGGGDLTDAQIEQYIADMEAWRSAHAAAQGEVARLRDALPPLLKGAATADAALNVFAQARSQSQQALNALTLRVNTTPSVLEAVQAAQTNTAANSQACRALRNALRLAFEHVSRRVLGSTETATPLLLWPVRLETRFAYADGQDRPNALKIRVYPDDIHVDSHEPELTDQERTLGAQYWAWHTAAPDDAAQDRSAWGVLAARLGPYRAAWVVQATAPGAAAVGSRPGAWSRAARAGLLPERWVALAYRGSGVRALAVGKPIRHPLDLAPTTGEKGNQQDIAWLTDFDKALEYGMGLTLTLDAASGLDQRIDRLLVIGIHTGADAVSTAAELTGLLAAHRYTNGLAVVARDTPTNNTFQGPAGRPVDQQADPARTLSDRLFDLERGPARFDPKATPTDAGKRLDGQCLSWGLGLPADVFSRTEFAEGQEMAYLAAATIQAVSTSDSPLLRRLGLGQGRSSPPLPPAWSPLPALRIGAAPYAFLPTIAPNNALEHADSDQSWQVRTTTLADDLRRRRVAAASFRQSALIDELLAHAGRSVATLALEFTDRTKPGAVFTPQQAWWNTDSPHRAALDAVVLRPELWASALASQRLAELRDGPQPTGLRAGAWGYVEGLSPARRPTLAPDSPANNPVYLASRSLGYQQTPSLTHAAAAAILGNGAARPGTVAPDALAGIDLSSERVQRARWLLDGVRQGQSLGTLLGYRFERRLQEQGLANHIARCRTLIGMKGDDHIGPLIRAVNDALLAVEAGRAQQQMVDQAQAVLNRARASLADQEASWARSLQPLDALRVAFDEGLRRANDELKRAQDRLNELGPAPRQSVVIETGDRGRPTRVLVDDQTEEYDNWVTHRGSLTKAVKRAQQERDALLPQAEAALSAFNEANARHDADLSLQDASQAVTSAQGQLDALAKPDQRALQGVHDRAVEALRVAVGGAWDQALLSSQVNRTADGLALYRRWRVAMQSTPPAWHSGTIPFGDQALGFPPVAGGEGQALLAQLQALAEEVDAVADLSVAEGVFQLVRGNPSRASSALDVLSATGASLPPAEQDVIRTPRSGAVVTHRFLITLPGTAAATSPWPAAAGCARAQAEPAMEAWAASVLPPPQKIVCAGRLRSASGQILAALRIDAAALGLSATTFVALAAGSLALAEGDTGGELAQLMSQSHRILHPDTPADALIEWLPLALEGLTQDELPLVDVVELAAALHSLVASARPLDARDLGGSSASIQVDEASDRIATLIAATRTQRDALAAARAAVEGQASDETLTALRAPLRATLPWRVPGSVPQDATQAGTLSRQAKAVVDELSKRLDRLGVLQTEQVAAQSAGQPEALVAQARALLGEDMVFLPVIAGSAEVLTPWLSSMQASSTLLPGGDAARLAAASAWLHQMACVRESSARLQWFQSHAQVLDRPGAQALTVGQFPWLAGEAWVGLPSSGRNRPRGRTSTLCLHPLSTEAISLAPSATQALVKGLLVDDWTEFTPSGQDTSNWADGTTWEAQLGAEAAPTEVTGVAFHFDRPQATAPNLALLAVARDAATWDLDLLQRTVIAAIDLAKSRAAPVDGRTEQLWFSDQLPLGAAAEQPWQWTGAQPRPLVGKRSHRSPMASGYAEHGFSGVAVAQAMAVGAGDSLIAFVQIAATQRPRALVLQWAVGPDRAHRAVWCSQLEWVDDGASAIWAREFNQGTRDTPSRRWAGELPAAGEWARLEVSASELGLEGQSVTGMAFGVVEGEATWGPAGRLLSAATPRAWDSLREDQIWFAARPPRGATLLSDDEGAVWHWRTDEALGATAPGEPQTSHVSLVRAGEHQHFFVGAAEVMHVLSGDRLVAHIKSDAAAPPRAIMLQWAVRSGPGAGDDWAHRAVWCSAQDRDNAGFWAQALPWGTWGTASRQWIGELPPAGDWQRLEADATLLGLADQFVSGMAFTLVDGGAAWGPSGLSRPSLSNTLILDA